jgi:chromate reductase
VNTSDAYPRRVLAIPGSVRSGSYNRLLLKAAGVCAPAGMVVELYGELGMIPIFDEDLEQSTSGGPDAVRRLRLLVGAADGLLISTPEYNHSMPGVLKNAIDWLSRPGPDEVLIGKPVAVLGASGGRWGTRLAQSTLRQVLFATESVVMPAPMLFLRDARDLFDDAGALVHAATRDQLTKLLEAFGAWIDRVAPVRYLT